jgi:hypothetical protein
LSAWYICVSTSNQSPSTFGSPKGNIWLQTIPPTPVSRSHHHQQFGRPAQNPVVFDLPVGPPFDIMNVKPQPCGALPSFGYRSPSGLVRSGLASGMPCLPKSGNFSTWLVNMSSTVSSLSICAPVVGEVPSLSSVAMISVLG